jgi:hypothetical protein
MFGPRLGTSAAARQWLLAAASLALVICSPVASRADDGMVDVTRLPRLEGAVPDEGQRDPQYHFIYRVPGSLPDTISAIEKLLAADGWVRYAKPFEQSDRNAAFKKGAQGLTLFYMTDGSRRDRSAISFTAERLYVNLPFPDGATEIAYQHTRPYLSAVTAAPVDDDLAFFNKELVALGWSPLSAEKIKANYPDAGLDDKIENGARAYFNRDTSGLSDAQKQKPVMLTLQRRADARTSVDIRVAPFALPQELGPAKDAIGLPAPNYSGGSSGSVGSADSPRRELHGTVNAGIPAVLAFYRREMALQNWKEVPNGTPATADRAMLSFSSADGTAVLEAGRKYDLTTVRLVAQLSESVVAARAKAKRVAQDEETAKFLKDAEEQRLARVAAADKIPTDVLQPLAGNTAPIPLPETATGIDFNGAGERLEFNSSSSVKSVVAFYRATMKPLGWKEQPSIINSSTMTKLEFAKGKLSLSILAMQLGPKTNVAVDGNGLKAPPVVTAAKPADTMLEADENGGLPVPKQSTLSGGGSMKMPGQTPFRRELDASVPAEVAAVLAFYRRELTRLQWKELPEGAVVKPDNVVLAFAAPDGPALLKLSRDGGGTAIHLAVKNPVEAAKAGIVPAPGQARVMLGNLGAADVSMTINAKTIKIAAGVGGPQTPKGPTLDLPPGKYKYTLKIAGRPDRTGELVAAADDTWGLMVAPDSSLMSLQMY